MSGSAPAKFEPYAADHDRVSAIGVCVEYVSRFCHPAPCYMISDKLFISLSDQYCNPERGFEPGSSGYNQLRDCMWP